MKEVSWPYFDPDYENLSERIFGPSCRVCISNECCENCTVVTVDSENKLGLLLEVIQVLAEAHLYISKSYVSSDAKWFMDVFHVRDRHGKKITDKGFISYLKQAISARKGVEVNSSLQNVHRIKSSGDLTAIEMAGINRPGLFSEISSVLANLRCNIVEAHAWSHNTWLACVAYVSDEFTSSRIEDPGRLATIEDHLSTILCPPVAPNEEHTGVKTAFVKRECSMTDSERRLHQIMLANRDFDVRSKASSSPLSASTDGLGEFRKTLVSIDRCNQRGYSVINIQCLDRHRLMFDIVCTLTDLQYVVFHASVTCRGAISYQEYFIRHKDGYMLCNENERERVVKCLEAAIERRICTGVRLEVCAQNRVGLVPDVTRVLGEYGLTVARADIETQGDTTMTAFYVEDVSGNGINKDVVESISKKMEPLAFEVKNQLLPWETIKYDVPCFSFRSVHPSQMGFSPNFIST